MQAGADALGLPRRADCQLAQAHQSLGAGARGDLVDQADAEPVVGGAGEGVAESHGCAARVRDDQGEASVILAAMG
ncbi:hypothetical protein GCM10009574_073720 [Streptomyces asiaticus]|uniref:Uncharacterized protein n=2 Tax=Streptomyces rhizosphaericus TaxID=114699 RepID=A0ABN1NZW9_9ACTN